MPPKKSKERCNAGKKQKDNAGKKQKDNAGKKPKEDLRSQFDNLPADHILKFSFNVDVPNSLIMSYLLLIISIRFLATKGGDVYRAIRSCSKRSCYKCFRVDCEVTGKYGHHTCTLVFLKSNLYLVAWGKDNKYYEFEDSPVTFRFTQAPGLSISYGESEKFPSINLHSFAECIRRVGQYCGNGLPPLEFFMWCVSEVVRSNRAFHRVAVAICPPPIVDESFEWHYRAIQRHPADIAVAKNWQYISKAIRFFDPTMISGLVLKATELKCYFEAENIIAVLLCFEGEDED